MRPDIPMRNFDPRKIAHYEKENYVAYYQKDWLKLLRVSVGMIGEAFALSLPQAVYGAYLIARAEIAFAPFPDNDVPKTEAYMLKRTALNPGEFGKPPVSGQWVCFILICGSIRANPRAVRCMRRRRKRCTSLTRL